MKYKQKQVEDRNLCLGHRQTVGKEPSVAVYIKKFSLFFSFQKCNTWTMLQEGGGISSQIAC